MKHSTDPALPRDQNAPAPGSPRRWWAVALALIAIGVGIRVWRVFFAGLPLRVDEIRVAWNLFERGPAELTQPLDYHQAAPIGFLWLVDTTIELLGRDAWVLRLIPLLAGCALLGVLAHVARKTLSPYAAWAVVLLASLSASLILQATDLKQYSMDALVGAALLAAAIPALRPDATARARFVLGAAGALTLVMSHGAFFICAGLGLVLGALALWARDRRAVLQLLALAGLWIAVVGLLYWFNLRFTVGREDLMTYWAPDFAPLPTQDGAWDWYIRIPQRLTYACGFAWGVQPVMGALILLGVLEAALRDRRWLAALLVPFGLVLAAAMAGQYPFAGRMIAFLTPFTLLLIGLGCQFILQRLNPLSHVLILAASLWTITASLKLGNYTDGLAVDSAFNWVDSRAKPAASAMLFVIILCTLLAILAQAKRQLARKTDSPTSPRSPTDNRWGRALIAAILLWAVGSTLPNSQLRHPWVGGRYDLNAPFSLVAQNRQPGDGLIIEKRLYYPYKHYAAIYHLPEDAPLLHLPYYAGDPQGQPMLDEALKHQRLWVLTGVNTRTGRGLSVKTQDLLLPLLQDFGPPTRIVQTGTVIAWLFERPNQTPAPESGARAHPEIQASQDNLTLGPM